MKSAIRNPHFRQGGLSAAIRNPQSAIRNGFTLMELLIAIGIMAVGGAMVAALFPAAIKENQSSYNDTLGTIICDNALATIKAMYTQHSTATVFSGISDTTHNPRCINNMASGYSFQAPDLPGTNTPPGYLGPISHYPINNTTAPDPDRQGFYFMALQHGTDNDYTFVIIAYQRVSNALPVFTPLTCRLKHMSTTTTPTDTIVVSDSDAVNYYPVNSLVIIDSVVSTGTCQPGEYARVVRHNNISGSNTEVILDHLLITPENTNVNCWVFRDLDVDIVRSPAMNVLVTRTALRDRD